jgi:hypothetical protein
MFGGEFNWGGDWLNDLWEEGVAASPPSLTPNPGDFATTQSVTMSDQTPGAVIYYTTDGSIPSVQSSRYTGPIKVSRTTSVNTVAIAAGYLASHLAKATYTIHRDPGLEWPTPGPVTYGLALGKRQLDAAALVPGTFTYKPAAGVVLPFGSHTLKVTFTPVDVADYATATITVQLTVRPALLTVSASNVSVEYGKPVPTLTYTLQGFVNGDNRSALRGKPAETTKAVQGSPPGTYRISIAQGRLEAANYTFLFKNGKLSITTIGIVATPQFEPVAGSYSSSQTVTISSITPGAVIYYTLDGSSPSTSSLKYIAAIAVSSSETVTAIAVALGYSDSEAAPATYTID